MRVYNHKTLKLLNSKPLVNDIQFTNFRYLFHSSNNLQKICSSSFCSKISGEPQKQFQKGPLDGIKVLDLSRILAGPFCTMLLGDLGAEIFKIEHPSRGDDTRTWGPPFTSKGSKDFY